jgi:hypothetical protein
VARVESHIGQMPLHPWSLTPIYKSMVEHALKAGAFGELDKDKALELIKGFRVRTC